MAGAYKQTLEVKNKEVRQCFKAEIDRKIEGTLKRYEARDQGEENRLKISIKGGHNGK